MWTLTGALIVLGCSSGRGEPHGLSNRLSEVTVSVSGWNEARVGVLLIDRSGKGTGWEGGRSIGQIAGCSHGFGNDVGIPDDSVVDDSTGVPVVAAKQSATTDSVLAGSGPPMYHYFTIRNDAVTKLGLIDQSGCEVRLDPIVAGRVDIAITGMLGGFGTCQDTVTVWVQRGVPVRRRLSWTGTGGKCAVKISAIPTKKPSSPAKM